MGAFSNTAANAYASQIKAVYEHLSEIKKVAQRLTPVEDLATFQAQIEDIHLKLDLLVEASELIVTATPTGEAILTGTITSIQTLLEIGKLPDDLVYQDQLEGLLNDLQGVLQGGISLIAGEVNSLELRMNSAEANLVVQQSTVTGLQMSYLNMLTGLSTQQSNLNTAISRIEVAENSLTLHDSRLMSLSQGLSDAEDGLSGFNSALSGLTSTVSNIDGRTTINANAIDSLQSGLVDLDTGLTGISSALSLLETTVTGLGNDLIAQSNYTTELESAIGSSGNLLPNADLMTTAGWSVVVAEDTWAGGLLEADLFNTMPAEVHHLGIRGIPSPTGIVVVQSPPVLVEAGRHYMVSGYPACNLDRDAVLSYKFFDSSGNVVGQGDAPAVVNSTASSDFSTYTRTWVKTPLAPTGVASLRVYLTVESYGTGGNAEAAIVRPMVERVRALQSEPGAWTSHITGNYEALATAVQQLTTEVSDLDGDVSAISSSVTNLTARVDNTEGALVNEIITSANKDAAHTASINNLNSRMTTAEGDVVANAGAISSLSTNVSTLGGTVSSHSSALTSLQSQVDALDVDVGGSGAAISALNTRVTAAEGTITSHSTAITNLQAAATNANKVFAQSTAPATAGRTEGDVWIDTANGNKFYTFDSGTSTWVARPDNNKNRVFVQGTAPTGAVLNDLWVHTGQSNRLYRWNGSTWVEVSDTRIATTASAVTALDTRVTAAEGVNTSQATQITDLQSAVTHPTTGLSALASANTNLAARVTAAEGVNSTQASSITNLTSRMTAAEGVNSGQATAITNLNTTVTSQGGTISSHASSLSTLTTTVGDHTTSISSHTASINGMLGKAGVTINANGYVTGWALNNNGSSGDFIVSADKFKVVQPGGGSHFMEYAAGVLRVSGHVEGSSITSSALGIGSTRISTGGDRLAPFTIRDFSYKAIVSGSQSMTMTLSGFVSPGSGSGYNSKRFARNKMDVICTVHVSGDYGNETCILERQYDGGTWDAFATLTMNCNYRGGFPMIVRHTTVNTWNTVNFRARTTQGRTQAMSFQVEILNYNESDQTAGSTSGTDTGGGSGGGGGYLPGPPGEPPYTPLN